MKGTMKVKRLNKSGLFVSAIDWDDCFKNSDNPNGTFVMIIEPFSGNNKDIIYYQKIDGGFLVEGEGYILCGTEKELKKRIEKRRKSYEHPEFDFVEARLE